MKAGGSSHEKIIFGVCALFICILLMQHLFLAASSWYVSLGPKNPSWNPFGTVVECLEGTQHIEETMTMTTKMTL